MTNGLSLFADNPHLVGFLGVMSTGAPGEGISIGNMSTHISTFPCRHKHKHQLHKEGPIRVLGTQAI